MIRSLSQTAGPLAPARVRIRGKNLAGVRKVLFGKQKATKVKRINRRTISVLTPRRSAPGTVTVRIRTRAGWSTPNREARYTFMARPTVTAVTPGTGDAVGGSPITIAGNGFSPSTLVLVGGRRASDVVVASPRKLTARTPPGIPGSTDAVRVRTRGGTSARTDAGRFSYLEPDPVDTAALTPAAGAVVVADVEWVTGGPDVAAPEAGAGSDWSVRLGPAATVPDVGGSFIIRPGATALPSGLAGTVTDVSTQADGGALLTVAPTPLDDAFDDLQLEYAGPIGEGTPVGRSRESLTGTVEFPQLKAEAFACRNRNGASTSFSGSLGLRVDRMGTNFHLDLGGLFRDPSISAWVSAQVTVFGKVTADANMTCKIKAPWQNAHRRVFPIGTTGATVSIGPTASFKISASGTFAVEHTSAWMLGFETDRHGNLRPINVMSDRGVDVSANGTFNASAEAGLSVQIAALDRLGIEGKLQLAANATAEYKTPPPTVCIDVGLALKGSIGAFLDVWITRWEYEAYERSLELARWKDCVSPETPVPPDLGPVITTTRLPGATVGTYYERRLTTADNRGGRWSIAEGRLPTGLFLDPDNGWIEGTPRDRVQDYRIVVRFTDGSGRSDTSPVHLYLNPPTQLGGGDVQVTLRWDGPADLDLHVFDPYGTEIWYGDRGPTDEGGFLDHDANAGCNEVDPEPAENVLWPRGASPAGEYVAYVVVWGACGTSNLDWHLTVRLGGVVVTEVSGYGDSAPVYFSSGNGRPQRSARPDPTTDVGKSEASLVR